jgi:hypothetical protein
MRLAPPIFIFFFTFRLGVEAPGVTFVLVAFARTFHKRIKTNGFLGKSGTFDFFFSLFFFAGTFSGSTLCQSYFHQSNRTGILLVIINLTFVYPLTTRRVDNRVPYAAFLVGSDQV